MGTEASDAINRARFTRAAAVATMAVSHSSHASTATGVHVIRDLVAASVFAAGATGAAVVMDWPDLIARWVLILSGAVFGTLAGALKFPADDRNNRAFFSLLTGPIIAMVALWMLPNHTSADSREWIIVVSFVASLIAWPVSEWVKRRKPVESTLDAFADRFGITTNKRRKAEPDEHERGDQ